MYPGDVKGTCTVRGGIRRTVVELLRSSTNTKCSVPSRTVRVVIVVVELLGFVFSFVQCLYSFGCVEVRFVDKE